MNRESILLLMTNGLSENLFLSFRPQGNGIFAKMIGILQQMIKEGVPIDEPEFFSYAKDKKMLDALMTLRLEVMKKSLILESTRKTVYSLEANAPETPAQKGRRTKRQVEFLVGIRKWKDCEEDNEEKKYLFQAIEHSYRLWEREHKSHSEL